jgi:retron-type reverse transcriptase
MTALIESLAEWTGLSFQDVTYIVATAPRRYKVFQIPKRNGGWRTVAQPSRELKLIQNLIVKRVLHLLPLHDAAHGYVKGRGIRSNANAHAESNYVLKLDIEDFFPSIRPIHFRRHLSNHAPQMLRSDEVLQVSNLIFWTPKGERTPRLCIGAPSSPFVSNTLMFDLDGALSKLADAHQVTYTRYADDMTFSCREKDVLGQFQLAVTNIVQGYSGLRLRINERKTVHISRAHRRMITGILLTPSGNLSIGRERKRLIRAMAHRFKLGQLSPEQIAEFKGLVAFAKDVEPEFVTRLKRRG